jgi:hypothetical protein
MQDASEESHGDQPRKRAALGDGISTGSGSPMRKSESPPPRRSKARPTSAPLGPGLDSEAQRQSFDTRPYMPKKTLWSPEQSSPAQRTSFDPSNIASVQAQRTRTQALQQPKSRKSFPSQPTASKEQQRNVSNPQSVIPSAILSNRNTPLQSSHVPPKDDGYDIILQPETRPISQEQLVAEVKGIYAGLVMVEAKCIEVDNKQATLAQADGAQSKLNNEQWQALIALHRTLLHEHHDFFLASQHPSASSTLRRLASKYAMPARMWRHGIHSFLELLRHRLPASLDHMLAFIYLAYTMMALLYETVPAFEDTWIECLGDLGRYRMAIEDDDIRDREVWTGVARHWYSKASDKAPTTGRLYHHLAILARPNALQQLFYYAKSLCVVVPFTSARESILTLFEPVLNADNGQAQYRLPPLDTAFVRAHGLLFTSRNPEKFEPAVQEFLVLLDNQIGRVTRKFMEQGYYIAVANIVAMMGFANKENILMRAIDASSNLANATLEIVLQRIGDPNVLSFIHVTLIFMLFMSRHPPAMRLLEAKFPWQSLTVMLNTLLAPYRTPERIEDAKFPLPVKDDVRPFTEDFALRGILWADGYYPDSWFSNDKIDEEEKYHEVASMTTDRKERILWLAHRVASGAKWTASAILAALQNKTFRSMALLTQISKFFPVTLASAINKTNSTATETNPQPDSNGNGPSQYFRHVWHQLRDEHSGPIIENTTVAAVLSSSYFIITHLDDGPKSRTPILPLSRASASKSWLKADLLPIATAFISACTLYLGNGKLESDWQLAMLATHNLSLSIKFIQQKLSKFPKTKKPAEFIMASTSLSSTWLLTKFFSVDEGRYKNPLVQAAMFLPLTNLFLTVFWIRFIRNYGVAKALEEGDLIAAIRAFWQKRSYAIIAVVLILWLLAKI